MGEEELAELLRPLCCCSSIRGVCIPGEPVKGQSRAPQYWGERSAGILGFWRRGVRRAHPRGWRILRPPRIQLAQEGLVQL